MEHRRIGRDLFIRLDKGEELPKGLEDGGGSVRGRRGPVGGPESEETERDKGKLNGRERREVLEGGEEVGGQEVQGKGGAPVGGRPTSTSESVGPSNRRSTETDRLPDG